MPDLWTDLLECFQLEPASLDSSGQAPRPAVFTGRNQQLEYHRLFGGQLLGQLIQAARLVCPDKAVKSLHTVFAREGRADEPVAYEAVLHHEGRSFATLTVTGRQKARVLATSSVCMHVVEDGPEHQHIANVPPMLGAEHRLTLDLIPWETRAVDDLNATTTGPPEFEFWMRTPEVGPGLGPALVAYATDLTLIGTALRPMAGLSQRGNGTQFTSAVTTHTLWFHRPLRTDDWLLFRQHSPLLAHGRCFGRGDVLTESGDLVASYGQEALLRIAT
ncbi:acyl-CoA thioesterase II [Mycobacterium sp. 1274761.0]|uniref:acyl-CoA thioesterase n=1 Tax=Mycobacterium sp. 1274761.0 TaxID=1834077 RepID=UPI0007FD3D5C|nr:acyl-CoA thioesterase domain-containing protein [Mycobacterium sp. 1274761.0]OBK77700.1 acyl-CoA thioesterase II [Mycobacterium sp. 1274761.0]